MKFDQKTIDHGKIIFNIMASFPKEGPDIFQQNKVTLSVPIEISADVIKNISESISEITDSKMEGSLLSEFLGEMIELGITTTIFEGLKDAEKKPEKNPTLTENPKSSGKKENPFRQITSNWYAGRGFLFFCPVG